MVYEPRTFWEERLRRDFSLKGAGYTALGLEFNKAMYRQRAVVLRRALRRHRIVARDARVVELGPGTGFYVAIWRSLGVRSLIGLDIAEVACERLRSEYPEFRFERADVTEPLPVADGEADVVTAFDVLFHIVDEPKFDAALQHAARALRPGGWLLLTDHFVHGEPLVGRHNILRRLDRYEQALEAAGIDVIDRMPIFLSMTAAYDVPAGWRQLSVRWWNWLSRRLRENPDSGRALGGLLGAVDRGATAVMRDGPSTELLVGRRRP